MQDRDKNTNLIEQLQDAWAFESRLLELVDDQAGSCQDPQSRRLYREHARTTRTQIRRIDQRLKAIGCPATGQGGWFTARLNRLASEVAEMDVWRDESTQLLITSYGIKQVECGMYRTLLDLAELTGDDAALSLARTSLAEEEATSRRLLFCIGMATRGKVAA